MKPQENLSEEQATSNSYPLPNDLLYPILNMLPPQDITNFRLADRHAHALVAHEARSNPNFYLQNATHDKISKYANIVGADTHTPIEVFNSFIHYATASEQMHKGDHLYKHLANVRGRVDVHPEQDKALYNLLSSELRNQPFAAAEKATL